MHQSVDSNRLVNIDASNWKFGVIVSRFNQVITDGLSRGCQQALVQARARADHITLVNVPGSFEIPFMARRLLNMKIFSAIICLGAVVKGDTPHFDFVAGETARGIMQLNLLGIIPVIFGVITCHTWKQAEERSGNNHANKGYEAGVAALEMLHVLESL